MVVGDAKQIPYRSSHFIKRFFATGAGYWRPRYFIMGWTLGGWPRQAW
jgi:hypothetical protein